MEQRMIIITGGAGFIGSACIWKLNQNGLDDILVVDNLGRTDKWKNLVNRRFRDYLHKSRLLEQLTSDRLGKVEAIIHMGACSATTEQDADYLMENNTHYAMEIARFAARRGIRLINASSAATYGDGAGGFSDSDGALNGLKPLNMYGYSKHRFDLWATRTGSIKKLVSLKFFNVFGPNEYHKGDMCSVVFKAFHQLRQEGEIRLFKSYRDGIAHGDQRRDFVYVKDCAELIWWLLQTPTLNGLYNVGNGRARTWNDLARAIATSAGKPANIRYIDMPDALRGRYQYFTQADLSKLREAGYENPFTPLEDAVADYVTHYLSSDDAYL
jgi:ADP-L-glycero-D-manno-heptose 6-epimerase